MLTKKELKQLRNEITLNSLFLQDYSNSLYIKNQTVCNFFASFLDYIYELGNGLDFYDMLEKYDNIDALYNYYLMYDDDPLIKDDYIAALCLSLYNGIVIYNIDENNNKVVVASYEIIGNNRTMHINKITKNNIFYDKRGYPYINKDGCKYYLNEFMKINN